MIFYLRAFSGSGEELGTISIYISRGASGTGESFSWEWQGAGINTGGTFEWSHNGNGYVMQLLESGARFATLLCPGWDAPPNPNGEPPRPWFSRQGNDGGLGSVARGTPARLIAGFNWQLK